MSHFFFALSFLLLLLSNPLFPQQPFSDLKHDGLIGKVKSIRLHSARPSKKSGNWVLGKVQQQRLILYDENGYRTKEVTYTDFEEITSPFRLAGTRISYQYDKKGNRSETIVYDPSNGQPVRFVRGVFEHNNSGNRVKETVYGRSKTSGSESIVEIYTHEYDVNEKRISTTYSGVGEGIMKWEYVNDEKGNPKEISYYKDKLLYARESYEYEFDEKGNWIKKVVSHWNKRKGLYELQEVKYRRIEYY
jgi:hypothetical protein